MRYQIEMMRAGSDSFRRYVAWTDNLMSFRPDRMLDAFLRPPDRPASDADVDAGPGAPRE
jgi:hypothetical protein